MASAEASESKSQEDQEDIEEQEEDDYESGSDDSLDAQLSGGDPLKCRMYENDYPKTGDHVIVEVKKIVDMGAYCNLLEYNNLEGIIIISSTFHQTQTPKDSSLQCSLSMLSLHT